MHCKRQDQASLYQCVQGEDVFPIPGTKRVKYLEQNAAAFQIKLTAEDIKQLETVFATDQVSWVYHASVTEAWALVQMCQAWQQLLWASVVHTSQCCFDILLIFMSMQSEAQDPAVKSLECMHYAFVAHACMHALHLYHCSSAVQDIIDMLHKKSLVSLHSIDLKHRHMLAAVGVQDAEACSAFASLAVAKWSAKAIICWHHKLFTASIHTKCSQTQLHIHADAHKQAQSQEVTACLWLAGLWHPQQRGHAKGCLWRCKEWGVKCHSTWVIKNLPFHMSHTVYQPQHWWVFCGFVSWLLDRNSASRGFLWVYARQQGSEEQTFTTVKNSMLQCGHSAVSVAEWPASCCLPYSGLPELINWRHASLAHAAAAFIIVMEHNGQQLSNLKSVLLKHTEHLCISAMPSTRHTRIMLDLRALQLHFLGC